MSTEARNFSPILKILDVPHVLIFWLYKVKGSIAAYGDLKVKLHAFISSTLEDQFTLGVGDGSCA